MLLAVREVLAGQLTVTVLRLAQIPWLGAFEWTSGVYKYIGSTHAIMQMEPSRNVTHTLTHIMSTVKDGKLTLSMKSNTLKLIVTLSISDTLNMTHNVTLLALYWLHFINN